MRKVFVIHKPNDHMVQAIYTDRSEMVLAIEGVEASKGYYVKWDEGVNGSLCVTRFNGEIVYTIEVVQTNTMLSLRDGLP